MAIKSSTAIMAVTLLACFVVQYVFVYPQLPQKYVTISDVSKWMEDCGKEGTAHPCQGWSEDRHDRHKDRWNRVLKALNGEPGGMTAAEAQSYFNKHGWKRWVPTAATLATLEARAAYWEAILNIVSALATLLAAVLVIYDRIEHRRR